MNAIIANGLHLSRALGARYLASLVAGALLGLAGLNTSAQAAQENPDFTFFLNGEAVENWQWIVADPDNWWLPLAANQGHSAARKVNIKPIAYQAKEDAVQISWNRKDLNGYIAIGGRIVNLAPYVDKAELILIARVDKPPRGPVKIAMGCGPTCEGAVPFEDMLKNAPAKEWIMMPVALDCFAKAGAEMDKISAPLKISTSAQLQLSIAGAFLQTKAEGALDCTPDD